MLGHVLRSPENSPSQSALCFVVDNMKTLPGRRGRHRANLFEVIGDDLLMRGISLSCYDDSQRLYGNPLALNVQKDFSTGYGI